MRSRCGWDEPARLGGIAVVPQYDSIGKAHFNSNHVMNNAQCTQGAVRSLGSHIKRYTGLTSAPSPYALQAHSLQTHHEVNTEAVMGNQLEGLLLRADRGGNALIF